MGKTKGEKYVISKLQPYSKERAEHFRNQKEVYYDAMDGVIDLINKTLLEEDGQTIAELLENTEELKDKKDKVGQVLNDVNLTLEYDV